MRVMGIDPGSRHTGFGVIEGAGTRWSVLAQGRWSPPARDAHARRLARLAEGLTELLEAWQPDVVVLEKPFLGVSSQSLIALSQARGALLAVVGRGEWEISEFAPAAIKKTITGSGRADKQQIRRMVSWQLRVPEAELSEDAADALAAALCFGVRVRPGQAKGR